MLREYTLTDGSPVPDSPPTTTATTERLADLMAAADRLEQLQRALDDAELREMGAQSAACHLGALVDEITAERDALEQQLEAQTVPQVQHLPADDTEGGAL